MVAQKKAVPYERSGWICDRSMDRQLEWIVFGVCVMRVHPQRLQDFGLNNRKGGLTSPEVRKDAEGMGVGA